MLYTCGSNANGQLGFQGEDSSTLVQIKSWNTLTISMDGGANHTLLLADKTLYGCGSNEFGQLGQSQTEVHQFIKIKENVDFIACGWNCSFISIANVIYGTGDNSHGQLGLGLSEKRVKEWQRIELEDIIKIKCGMRHSLLLSKDFKLYGCGLGKQGVLASIESTRTPSLIAKGVTDIACGQFHSVFIKDGAVYVMGRNKFQVLENEMKFSLDPVFISLPVLATRIISGWHTIGCVGIDGRVFVWGRNDKGQTGSTCKGISELSILQGCTDLVFGSEHALALMPSGKVYVWGWNEHGNLGLGHQDDVIEPTLLPGSYRYIGSGAGHSLFYQ